MKIDDLKAKLKNRLKKLNHFLKDGEIPGEIDTIELEQFKGRVRELEFIMELLESEPVTVEIICIRTSDD